jgi:hemerythrin-like domain-containing protein
MSISGIPIQETESADFQDPLALMVQCHARIARFAAALCLLAEEFPGGKSLDESNRDLAYRSLRYFSAAAPLHTADEEESLFPRLYKSESAQSAAACTLIARLNAEHRSAEAQLSHTLELFMKWIEMTEAPDAFRRELIANVNKIAEDYRLHIQAENEVLFPLCAEILSAEELHAIGKEMAVRRGLDPDNLTYTGRCRDRRMARAGTPDLLERGDFTAPPASRESIPGGQEASFGPDLIGS